MPDEYIHSHSFQDRRLVLVDWNSYELLIRLQKIFVHLLKYLHIYHLLLLDLVGEDFGGV